MDLAFTATCATVLALDPMHHCVLCPMHVTEDWLPFFFLCNFSIQILNYLQIEWELGDTFEAAFS
jgi:hypothetical protein